MTRYADPESISPSAKHLAPQYLRACGVEYDVLGVPINQLTAGDVVIVGPWDTWSWLPPHITIEVVPDGGDVTRTDAKTYALKRAGLPPGYSAKTSRAKGWKDVQIAEAFEDAVRHVASKQNSTQLGTAGPPAIIITDVEQGREVLRKLSLAPAYAFDFETDSLDPYVVGRRGAAFADDTNSWWFVEDVTRQLRDEIIHLLQTRPFRGSNLKYDIKVAAVWGETIPESFAPVWDTQILHWLLRPDDFQHGLKFITKQQLKRDVLALDDVGGVEDFWRQPYETQALYAAAGDARNSYDLVDHLWDRLSTPLRELYTRIEQPVVPVLAAMELEGLTLDRAELGKAVERVTERCEAIKRELSTLGFNGNPDADSDLAGFLYTDLHLPVLARTPKLNRGKVDVDTLLRLQLLLSSGADADSLRAVQLIREWSRESKSLNTFYLPPWQAGLTKFYFDINQTSVKTGRLSTRPNAQNWPGEVQQIAVAPPGCVMYDADYGQIEPRLSAHYSQDPEMLRDFNERAALGIDVYQSLGMGMGHSLESLGKHTALRKNIKTIFLADQYGSGALKKQAIALRQGDYIPLEQCRAIEQGIHKARPHFYNVYQPEVIKQARRSGKARDPLFGRERLLARQLYTVDPGSRDAAEREAINFPNQAGAGGVIKLAMPGVLALSREAGGVMINQIHDEVLGWVEEMPEAEQKNFGQELAHRMESVVELSVPIIAEVGFGPNWYAAKNA